MSSLKHAIQKAVAGSWTFEVTPKYALKVGPAGFTSMLERFPKSNEPPLALGASSIQVASPKIYVAKLPGHPWDDTIAATNIIREAGFQPVPHIPARGFRDLKEVDEVFKLKAAGSAHTELWVDSYGKKLPDTIPKMG